MGVLLQWVNQVTDNQTMVLLWVVTVLLQWVNQIMVLQWVDMVLLQWVNQTTDNQIMGNQTTTVVVMVHLLLQILECLLLTWDQEVTIRFFIITLFFCNKSILF